MMRFIYPQSRKAPCSVQGLKWQLYGQTDGATLSSNSYHHMKHYHTVAVVCLQVEYYDLFFFCAVVKILLKDTPVPF